MQRCSITLRECQPQPCDHWHLAATRTPRLHIVIIPGNPGSVGYYGELMHRLHRAHRGAAHVSAVASQGFSLEAPRVASTFALSDAIAHKRAYLRQRCLDAHDLPVVVLGHSIGFYMAMRAVRLLEGDGGDVARRVAAVVGLMPFVQTSSERKQLRVRRLAQHPRLLASAAAVLSLLPAALLRAAVRAADGSMDGESVTITVALIRRDIALAAFTLARHEFEDLRGDTGWRDLRHFAAAGRAAVLGATHDPWWPQDHHDAARDVLDPESVHQDVSLGHAFCVNAEQTGVVARWAARQCARACQRERHERDGAAAVTAGR